MKALERTNRADKNMEVFGAVTIPPYLKGFCQRQQQQQRTLPWLEIRT